MSKCSLRRLNDLPKFILFWGLPWWLSVKEFDCQFRRHGFDPLVGKIPLEKEMAIHSHLLAWRITMDVDLQTYRLYRLTSTFSKSMGFHGNVWISLGIRLGDRDLQRYFRALSSQEQHLWKSKGNMMRERERFNCDVLHFGIPMRSSTAKE